MGNFCSNCGAQLNGANFCPNCGTKAGGREAQSEAAQDMNQGPSVNGGQQQSQAAAENGASKNQGAAGQAQAGQQGTYENNNGNGKKKFFTPKAKKEIAIIMVGIVAVIFIIAVIAALIDGQKMSKNIREENAPYINKDVPVQQGTALNKIQENTGVTAEQAQKIIRTLEQCEVFTDKIVSVVYDKDLAVLAKKGEKLYRINTSDIGEVGMWLYSNGEIMRLVWNENGLYDKGQIESKISDFLLTTKDKEELKASCEDLIIKLVNYPDTAKFAPIEKWRFYKHKYCIYVWAYVQARNNKSEIQAFPFEFQITPDKKKALYVNFNGEKYGSMIDSETGKSIYAIVNGKE